MAWLEIINLSCVFKKGWELSHAKILYEQLIKAAIASKLVHIVVGTVPEVARVDAILHVLVDVSGIVQILLNN